MEIDLKYKSLLLEILEEKRYQLSLQLEKLKGKPNTADRKNLSDKQSKLETLQHIVLMANN
jgi:hypothetical protein